MIYTALKKHLSYYLITGIILSMVIISCISLRRYKDSLSDTVSKTGVIRINADNMKQAASGMDLTMERIRNVLPENYFSRSNREILLLALDAIKMNIKGSELSVTGFNEGAGLISLPVNIRISPGDYTALVNDIGYLQSMNLPQFDIRNISIEKSADKQYDSITCAVDGVLKMPAERLKGDREI